MCEMTAYKLQTSKHALGTKVRWKQKLVSWQFVRVTGSGSWVSTGSFGDSIGRFSSTCSTGGCQVSSGSWGGGKSWVSSWSLAGEACSSASVAFFNLSAGATLQQHMYRGCTLEGLFWYIDLWGQYLKKTHSDKKLNRFLQLIHSTFDFLSPWSWTFQFQVLRRDGCASGIGQWSTPGKFRFFFQILILTIRKFQWPLTITVNIWDGAGLWNRGSHNTVLDGSILGFALGVRTRLLVRKVDEELLSGASMENQMPYIWLQTSLVVW